MPPRPGVDSLRWFSSTQTASHAQQLLETLCERQEQSREGGAGRTVPADAAQARLAGVLDGAAELVDVAVALRVLRQLDRVGAAAGQVDELDRDVVCSGLVAHAGERLDLHVVDAHVDVADAEALQVGHGDRVRGEVLAAHVHRERRR